MASSAGSAPNVRPGACIDASGVSFCVWAPDARTVKVEFANATLPALPLARSDGGYFTGSCPEARHRTTYRYALDEGAFPDPYSRYQPEGPHGPSMVIDPGRYTWADQNWKGLDASRQVIYELHIGTFTHAGTFEAAASQLEHLRELGITSIELLPLNEFVGSFGWGYDGVNLFAPFHHYGEPDDVRRFVDRAHACGLGVILDVVYNHFGNDGSYLPKFAAEYVDGEASSKWGPVPNFRCEAMRRMVIDNATYWISEFHMDGLRLDATQSIHDPDHPRLLAELVAAARAASGERQIVISGEDYLQRTPLLGSMSTGGPQLDQLWNDDFHHAARVALTGNRDGYFRDFTGRAQELLSALRHGFLFQGQYDGWYQAVRGAAVSTEPLSAFVVFTQNHDQIANTLYGQRLHELTSSAKYRALTGVLLLGPATPLLFMGQEFNASTPFAYFADYQGETAEQLWTSRRRELLEFDEYADPQAQARVMNPCSRDTLARSTLNFDDRARNAATLHLYTDLVRLRRADPTLDTRPSVPLDGATLSENAFVLRWRAANDADRLLLVNLGSQITRRAIPEPLLAAPLGKTWRMAWSSNDPRYGGSGTSVPVNDKGWQFDAECATFCLAEPAAP